MLALERGQAAEWRALARPVPHRADDNALAFEPLPQAALELHLEIVGIGER
jgi:hypothetical protein